MKNMKLEEVALMFYEVRKKRLGGSLQSLIEIYTKKPPENDLADDSFSASITEKLSEYSVLNYKIDKIKECQENPEACREKRRSSRGPYR